MSFFIPGHAARLVAGGALSCFFFGAAVAQPDTARPPLAAASAAAPTLAQAVEAAWQRATQAREAQGQAQRAQADRVAASSLWPATPALELSHRDDRWQTSAGRRETEAGVTWPLWLPGQRQARGAVAEAELELARAAADVGRLHYAGLVREAAWNVSSLRVQADLAQTQLRYQQEIADDVSRRVKAGDLAHADALAAQSEMLAARSALLAARLNLASGETQWASLTGLAQVANLHEAAQQPDALAEQASFAIEAHPEARMAALSVQRSHKRLDVVSATQREPTELLLRIRQDLAGRGDAAQNSIGVGVRIPLGTAGRNLPLQASALSELEVTQTVERRTKDRLASDVTIAQAALRTAAQQLEADRQRAALLRERATLIERSFKAGQTSLPEFLRALSTAAQADTLLARQQVAFGLARARLQQALGILP